MAGVIDLVSSDDEENPGTQDRDGASSLAAEQQQQTDPPTSVTPGGSLHGSGNSIFVHSSSAAGTVTNGNPNRAAGGNNNNTQIPPEGKGTTGAVGDNDGSGSSDLLPPPDARSKSPIDGNGSGSGQDPEPESLESRGAKSLLPTAAAAAGSRGVSTAAAGLSASSSRDHGVCHHFWRAGDYNAPPPRRQRPAQGSMDHVRVHPKFLHSNATSHKWALGAIAELLDNAIDEIQNGATFVNVDKITNPRDGSPALLVQDDGGGMGPEGIRQCMSLGYSRKNTNATIGQYGNGFKTSTMRLGADVVVFTRNSSHRITTQSVGLLSYTFLRKTGHEDIVVPMLDYQLSASGREPTVLVRSNMDDWLSNLATIMRWSPYASEAELLKQFNDIGWHGTKVVVFNLWLNDDGILELDFDSDENDIQLRVGAKERPGKQINLPTQLAQEHIVNRYRLSLRVYASILYLQMPPHFRIILRNLVVEHHSIAMDLKFCEYIVYKPQIGGINKETSVITTIGFTKEAPMVNVHGFNVYHKNRLIMPFWKVFQDNSSRGRGVVGVLEANFIEPAHDKQDFERTAVFLRLEARLKAMTVEYWNLHCHLIGYQSSVDKRNRKTVPQTEIPVAIPAVSSHHPLLPNPPVTVNQIDTQMAVTSLSPSTSGSSSEGGGQLPNLTCTMATTTDPKNNDGSFCLSQRCPGTPALAAPGRTLQVTSSMPAVLGALGGALRVTGNSNMLPVLAAPGGTLRVTGNSTMLPVLRAPGGTLRVTSNSGQLVATTTECNNSASATSGAAAPATPPRVGVDAEIILLLDDDCVVVGGEGTKFVSDTNAETSPKGSKEELKSPTNTDTSPKGSDERKSSPTIMDTSPKGSNERKLPSERSRLKEENSVPELETVESDRNVLKRTASKRQQRTSDVPLPALKKPRVKEEAAENVDESGGSRLTAVPIPSSVQDVVDSGGGPWEEIEVPEEGGSGSTVLTVHRQDTAISMTGILEQNISLRAKCKEYEKREKDWEEKVLTLERELEEHKVKYSQLQEQMRLIKAAALGDNENEVQRDFNHPHPNDSFFKVTETSQERFTTEEIKVPKLESEMEE